MNAKVRGIFNEGKIIKKERMYTFLFGIIMLIHICNIIEKKNSIRLALKLLLLIALKLCTVALGF